MIDEALRTLIAFVESASPVVWAAAQQEVMVQIVINTRTIWIALLIGILSFVIAVIGFYKDDSENMWLVAGLFGSMAAAVCFVLVISSWNRITSLTMNPEFQAIKILTQFVKGACN